MSKLAHSNDATMAQIERDYENSPQEVGDVARNPLYEPLWRANADKASILKRIDTDLAGLRQLSVSPYTSNGPMNCGAIGALESLRKAIVEGGYTEPRGPADAF